MEIFLTALSSFLGGSLITALGFVFSFSNKVSSMNTTLDGICQRFDQHLVNPPVCSLHQKIAEDVAGLEALRKSNAHS